MKKRIFVTFMALFMLFTLAAFAEQAVTLAPIPGINLTPILEAIIGLIATLITVKAIPWIKARTTAAQQELLMATTKTLVFAAEQIYQNASGKDKLMYVKGKLLEKGFTVDIDAIEAMVREMNFNKNKPPISKIE